MVIFQNICLKVIFFYFWSSLDEMNQTNDCDHLVRYLLPFLFFLLSSKTPQRPLLPFLIIVIPPSEVTGQDSQKTLVLAFCHIQGVPIRPYFHRDPPGSDAAMQTTYPRPSATRLHRWQIHGGRYPVGDFNASYTQFLRLVLTPIHYTTWNRFKQEEEAWGGHIGALGRRSRALLFNHQCARLVFVDFRYICQ